MDDPRAVQVRAAAALIAELSEAAGAWDVGGQGDEVEVILGDLRVVRYRLLGALANSIQVPVTGVLRDAVPAHPEWWAIVGLGSTSAPLVPIFVRDRDFRRLVLTKIASARDGQIWIDRNEVLGCYTTAVQDPDDPTPSST